MKMMHCPMNGLRNISEFVYGGEVKEMPNPNTCSDREWADYVFYADNQIGIVREWWMHAASSFWFIAERHTASDKILKTYTTNELFSTRVEFDTQGEEPQS